MGNQRFPHRHGLFNHYRSSLVLLDLWVGLVHFWSIPILLYFDWYEHYRRLSQTFFSQSIPGEMAG